MKGFHQNVVEESSRKFLRIICHLGIYEYLRMPFGIKNAPAFFQRMMDTEFSKELREGWLKVYIDDLILFHTTWEEHLESMEKVLIRAKAMGMTISLSKCHFGFQECKALGHRVSGLWVAVDQNAVAAVLQKPCPKDKQELSSFLGFTSYYRAHIPNFGIITRSLYKLYAKGVAFEMTKERIDAVNKIKQMLTTAPILFHPDFEKPFKLYVDASIEGLGAALHQQQIIDGKPKEGPIVFISRK
jgi:hypothetical protein